MRLRTACAVISLCAPLYVNAALPETESATTAGAPDSGALGPIVVTATRNPRSSSETLAATTVIEREDIERLQARSVQEVLRRSPGVSISNQGGDGKLTSLFLRGADSDQVLVLVNGVRYGSATAGLAAFQDLPVDQIERIEIVRGPRSSLYGSEAIGGVIQIFTRDGGQGTRPYFNATAGRYDSYEGQAGLAGGNADSNYNISISGTRSDGFNACTGRAPDPVTFAGGAGCFTDEPDDDGYRRVAGSLRAGHRFDSGLRLDVHALRADANSEFDGSFTNESETLQQVLGASASFNPLRSWNSKLSVGRGRDESNDFLNDVFVSSFNTQRDSVTWQNDIAVLTDDLLTLGLDYRNERVQSTTAFEETSRYNAGVFGQYIAELGSHQIQLAGRGDENEQFGSQATGSITWGWEFAKGTRVTALYGTAFKAPTFNDLYFPGFSNPDLEPEESQSVELGLLGERDWGGWSLHAYETDIDDLIALDAAFVPANISQARIRGVEAAANTQIRQWLLNFSATWLDTEDQSDGPNAGNSLARRPDYSAQLDVDRAIRQFSLGASVYAADSRFDDLANTRKLDSYVLLDLRGEMQLNSAWRVQAKLANLLNEDYETAAFFNQPGRSLFVTLRYQPE